MDDRKQTMVLCCTETNVTEMEIKSENTKYNSNDIQPVATMNTDTNECCIVLQNLESVAIKSENDFEESQNFPTVSLGQSLAVNTPTDLCGMTHIIEKNIPSWKFSSERVKSENEMDGDIVGCVNNKFPTVSLNDHETLAVKIESNIDGDSEECVNVQNTHTFPSFPSNEPVEVKIENDKEDITLIPSGDKIEGNETVGIKVDNAGVDYMEVDHSLFSVNDISENIGTDDELDEKQTIKTAVVNIENDLDDPSQESNEQILGNVQNDDCLRENRNLNGQDNITKNVMQIKVVNDANKSHLGEEVRFEKGRNSIKNQILLAVVTPTTDICMKNDRNCTGILNLKNDRDQSGVTRKKNQRNESVLVQERRTKSTFKCNECGSGFCNHKQFPRHYIELHISELKYKHRCHIGMCSRYFSSEIDLRKHNWEDHNCVEEFCCGDCYSIFRLNADLQRHMTNMGHKTFVTRSDNRFNMMNFFTSSKTTDPNDLSETKMHYVEINHADNQIIEDIKEENVARCDISAEECLICHAVLDQNMSLKKHLSHANHDVSDLMKYYSEFDPNKKQQRISICPHCPSYFETNETLKKHIWENHRKNKWYCCSCCYYCCKMLYAIISHLEETGHKNMLIEHESVVINAYYNSSLKSLKVESDQISELTVDHGQISPAVASGLKEIFRNSDWEKVIIGGSSIYFFNIRKCIFEKIQKLLPSTGSKSGEYNGKKNEKNQSGRDNRVKKYIPELTLPKTVEIKGSYCKKKRSIKDNVKKIKSQLVRVKSSTEIKGFNGEKNVKTQRRKIVCAICCCYEYSKLIRYHTWYCHIMNKVEWYNDKNLSHLQCQLCISKRFDSRDSYKQHMRSHILDPECKLIFRIVDAKAQCGFSTMLTSSLEEEGLSASSNKQSEGDCFSTNNILYLNFGSSLVANSKKNISDPSNLQENDETFSTAFHDEDVLSGLDLQEKDSHILSDNCDDGIRLPAPICLKDNTEISPSSDDKFSQSDDLQDETISKLQFPHDQRKIPQNQSKDSDFDCGNTSKSKKTGEKEVGNYLFINLKKEDTPGKQLFQCDICGKPLRKGTQYQNSAICHVRFYHHGDKNGYYCKPCEEIFNHFASYKAHLKSKFHQTENNQVDTSNLSQIFKGLSQDHSEFISTKKNQNKCTYCEKSFLSKKSCRMHEKYTHEIKCMSVNDETTVFRCEKCGKTCKTIGALKMHIRLQNHVILQTKKIKKDERGRKKQSTNDISSDKKVKKRFLCQYCGQNFKYPTRHMYQCHSDNMTYKCKSCGKGFLTEKSYNSHRETLCHKCDTCGYICKTKNLLTKHMQSHLGLKPRMCIYCSKPFYSLTDFLKHQTTCSKLKCFICDICDKRYSFKWSLIKHITTHKGKTVQCPQCDKLFYHKWDLELHLSIHHKVGDSILCDKCGKMLRYSQAFDYHKKICK